MNRNYICYLKQRFHRIITYSIPFFFSLSACTHVSTDVRVGDFDANKLSAWETRSFKGHTQYALETLDGQTVLKASTDKSASALYKRVAIDIHKTPYLNWTWRVDAGLDIVDEKVKRGDDFAARVYVVIAPKPFHLKPRSLNYVWSSQVDIGDSWRSPYTDNVILLALQSGSLKHGEWVIEKRNIREDLKRYFGEDPQFIEGVAIMTDADNSGQRALAYYRNIYFSEE